jgi:hypothetical protein
MDVRKSERRGSVACRSSGRLLIVLSGLVLGALAGAYLAATRATGCVDRVDGDSYCTTEVQLSPAGAAVGAMLASGTTFRATRR